MARKQQGSVSRTPTIAQTARKQEDQFDVATAQRERKEAPSGSHQAAQRCAAMIEEA
jgi:hypothetical protein